MKYCTACGEPFKLGDEVCALCGVFTYKPEPWTVDSAMAFAAENMQGGNVAGEFGENPSGALQLCAWAISRELGRAF